MIKVCLYLQRYCIRWYNIIIVVNKKGRQMKIKVNKRIKGITIAAAALVLIIVVAVMFIIVRYTPAKEKMSGYTYYGIDRNTDKVFVIIDGELYPDTGIIYKLHLTCHFSIVSVFILFPFLRRFRQNYLYLLPEPTIRI